MWSSFAASWDEGMYQGCIMRNMRTSCGSRTFPESSNSEGQREAGQLFVQQPWSLTPTPQPEGALLPPPPPPPQSPAFPGFPGQEEVRKRRR